MLRGRDTPPKAWWTVTKHNRTTHHTDRASQVLAVLSRCHWLTNVTSLLDETLNQGPVSI